MMTNDDYQHFVCIVAGDNPDELMKEYDCSKNIETQIIYRYKDLKKVKLAFLNEYNARMEYSTNNVEKEYIRASIDEIRAMTEEEFAERLLEDNDDYYIDNDTGDIKRDANPNGHWSYYKLGKIFSIPFLTKDGREVFQTHKKDIDWDKIHLSGKEVYERVWEMVMDGSLPNDEHEQVLFDNMKDKKAYFEKFETKNNYVVSNTAFWGYAFLSDKTGWLDAENVEDQFEWMSNFYDMFIKNLSEDTLLTIYECKK